MKLPIYMDNHATTPLDPRVLDAMLPYLVEHFGNAASRNHAFGWRAEEAVDEARSLVAGLIGCSEKEIVFTSGATESNNLAIKGVAAFHREKGNHIVTAATEHKCVLDACKRLEGEGFRVTYLPVDADGLIAPERVAEAITEKTILVSVMAANNEIGVLQPIAEIGRITRSRRVLFHTDATQAVGKIPVDVDAMGVDLLSFSAHKMYGPKGVGALYVRREPRARLSALIDGGGQERGLRSGTLNVPGIVGFGAACRVSGEVMAEESDRLLRLRNRLLSRITDRLDAVVVNGSLTRRLPNNLNLSFGYVEGEAMLMAMEDVAVSSGSACTSASIEPSHVLRALTGTDERAQSSLRFGLGRFNVEEEVDYVADRVVEVVRRLRELSPLYDGPGAAAPEMRERVGLSAPVKESETAW
jgi:cysteine desulfurase